MRPHGEAGRLFTAFSAISCRAFADDRLLSCQALSKGPDQGQALSRFLRREPPVRCGPGRIFLMAARYVAVNGLHFLFMLMTALFARLRGWRSPFALLSPEKSAAPLLVIDIFALLPRIAGEGRWRDLYLPGLAESARAAGYRPLNLYRLYGSRAPLTAWRALGVLAASGEGCLETHLLTPADWLRLLRHVLLYPLSLVQLIRSLRRVPPESPERYIREALCETAGQCALGGEARRLAGLRLGLMLAQAPPGSRIISWYENQCVNKAFQRGIRQAEALCGKAVPLTGAQLFLWPPELLNNHADDAEAALGLAPDAVLVNGPHFLPDNSRQNYAAGPSLRYSHLFTAFSAPSLSANHLLVLLSYHPEESRRVLALARGMAGKTSLSMVFRFHPATRPGDYADLLPPLPRLSTGPLPQALAEAGAVMGSGSGSLAEAVALGLPALVVEGDCREPGLNYLPGFGKGLLWEGAASADDAAAALEALLARRNEEGRGKAVARFKSMLFTEPTPERIARMLAGV